MPIPEKYRLIEFESIDSTNLEAMRLIKNGEVLENLVITAKLQTLGKGRLGRNWVSPEGNLFLSVVANFRNLHVCSAIPQSTSPTSIIPFVCAISIGEALAEFIPIKPLYKWPNDVLIEGRKISGVLIENIGEYVVMGIGINVNNHPDAGTKLPATSLRQYLESNVEPKQLLKILISKIDYYFSMDWSDVIKKWNESAYGIGRKIAVDCGEKKFSGIYKGIDDNGRLILIEESGRSELISFGDVCWI